MAAPGAIPPSLWRLSLCAVGLWGLGMLGIARAEELALGSGRFLRQQAVWGAAAGVLACSVALGSSYRRWLRAAYPAMAVCTVLLALVLLCPAVNGAHRWFPLGRFTFQPSELTKVVYVLALAHYLERGATVGRFVGLWRPLAFSLVPMLLVLREPDLGTALVFLPVFAAMALAAGAPRLALAGLAGMVLLATPLLWSQMTREQRSRVTALAEQNAPEERPTADGYHLHQAKQLSALGGVGGSVWPAEPSGHREALHLPAAHTDFILSVLGERLGLLGPLLTLTLSGTLASAGLAIAAQTREPGGRLLAAGVAALFAVQAIINAAMTAGLAPVTGLSLPLVSYGGSGLLAHGWALGLLGNVALRPQEELAAEPFRLGGARLAPVAVL